LRTHGNQSWRAGNMELVGGVEVHAVSLIVRTTSSLVKFDCACAGV
jgi:hypothetical protein